MIKNVLTIKTTAQRYIESLDNPNFLTKKIANYLKKCWQKN
jgi:hypothetical protein